MTLSDKKEFLKEVIKREVFVSSAERRIIDSSGVKESLWLMDFRRVILKPKVLSIISEVFFDSMKIEQLEDFQVGGIEVAAIPLVSGVVMKSVENNLFVNGFFIRKSRKKTGLLNMIEGEVYDKDIVLIDDIINSGGSFLRQIQVIESLGKKVKVVFTLLRFRDIPYYEDILKRDIKIVSLFTLDDFSTDLPVKNLLPYSDKPTPQPYKVKWFFKSDGAHFEYVVPKSKPLLLENKLYFGTDSGNFYALDTFTGNILWSHKVLFGSQGKLIFSSPCSYKDLVFFGGYDGNFYALNKDSGEVKWIALDADWIGSSPCVASDLGMVYVGMEFGFWKQKGGVAAYSIETGERVWQSQSRDFTHGSPTYSIKNKIVVCGSNDGYVYGIHAKTGKTIWIYNAGGEVKGGCVLSPTEKYIAFGSFNKQYVVLNTKTGSLVRIFETLQNNYSSPAWNGEDRLICSSLDKRIYAFNVKTGATDWLFTTNARVFANPVIQDEKVYCGNNGARLYVLDIKTGKEVGIYQATERITNAVVIDKKNNIIYLPTFANEIIALEVNKSL